MSRLPVGRQGFSQKKICVRVFLRKKSVWICVICEKKKSEKKKSRSGLNTLLLQIKTSAFTALAIPLAIYKTRGAVKIAIQNYLCTFFFRKDTRDNYSWIADEFVSSACFKTCFIEVAKYLCFVLGVDLYSDGVDLAFCSEISFPGTTNLFGWWIGGFHKRWKQNGNYRY